MNTRFFQTLSQAQRLSALRRLGFLVLLLSAAAFPGGAAAQDAAPAPAPTATGPVLLTINAGQAAAKGSPMFYGLMTEEINYSYDGGIYGELVNNRTFKDRENPLRHWTLVQDAALGNSSSNSITVVTDQPLNDVLTNSLKLHIDRTDMAGVGIANDGFWGIPVQPNTTYRASFYARAADGFTGPIHIAIFSTNSDGAGFAGASVPAITADWKKYEVTLTTGNVPPSKSNQLVIKPGGTGTVFFNLVSLFPPTYNDRPNGNRRDIMQLLADMHPSFLRFPGGNYLEGGTFATRFNWKETIHDISKRPGHQDDAWGYWSSDGMGLLEFLEWCEDLHMEPVLAIYAGYSMRSGGISNGPALEPYVRDGLDEIEYVTGDAGTTWGAQRAADGHPAPFPLHYVELGNEDNLGSAPQTYDGRFTRFYDAIKAKYPKLQVIATSPRVTSRAPDVVDSHLYVGAGEVAMEGHFHDYDNRPRTGPKVFEGEWATRAGRPTPKMSDALGDASFLIGMERNSDLVIMECYAPLFVNVSDQRSGRGAGGSMQWPTDLIGYDALGSYGSPSYYVQKMFSLNHGDDILSATVENVPMREPAQAGGGRRGGGPQPTIFTGVTRDSKTKAIYVKVVNGAGKPQDIHVEITGASAIQSTGQATVLSAASPDDTNSIQEPKKLVPVTTPVTGLGKSFTRTFPPYSVTVLQLQGQ